MDDDKKKDERDCLQETSVDGTKIPLPPLRPSIKAQPLSYEEYASCVPEKLELFNGYLIGEDAESQRFKLLLGLFKNLGVYRVVQLLDDDTLNDIERMRTIEIKRLSDKANIEYTIAMQKKKATKQIAENLIKLGFDNDAVQEATELDLDTIQKLREQSE